MVKVIAEPGCTAEGDFDAMKALVAIAAEAGCNAFKNQWVGSPAKMVKRRRAPKYLKYYRWLQFPAKWHAKLAAQCAAADMDYGCSVYLPQDVAAVAPFVNFLKVSSFEAEDQTLIDACLATGLPVFISRGMGARLVSMSPQIWYLHCTSAYPAPTESLQLGNLRRSTVSAGLSDHSHPSDVWIGALATAAGARVIETHMRSDQCSPKNPDYAVARDPKQLADYIRNVRFAERACEGDPAIKVDVVEAPMRRYKVKA